MRYYETKDGDLLIRPHNNGGFTLSSVSHRGDEPVRLGAFTGHQDLLEFLEGTLAPEPVNQAETSLDDLKRERDLIEGQIAAKLNQARNG